MGIKAIFRTLLPQLHYHKSNISPFVKHAQFVRDVLEKMKRLTEILKKNFVVDPYQLSSSEECTDIIQHFRCTICINREGSRVDAMTNEPVISESSTGCGNNQIVTQNEADLALDLSASLLESISTEGDYNIIEHDIVAYEDGKYEATSNLCVTAALEHKILTLYGKTDGTVFKYAKMQLCWDSFSIKLSGYHFIRLC